ncbi:MAG TPA: L,D-transpeptidase family protein, partial [Longimicrobiales bacterium]|nr:L,D-transpeptidase family protein [Longimicrobiales bacterium]
MVKSIVLLSSVLAGAFWLVGCGNEPEVEGRDYVRSWLRRPAQDGIVHFVSGDTVHVSDAARDFYRKRRWRAAWTQGHDDLLEQGWRLYGAIGRAHEDGLSRERYRFDVMEKLQAKLKAEGDNELSDSVKVAYLAALDVLLTEGFTRYANDLVAGTLDPHEAGVDWRIPRGEAIQERVLGGLMSGMTPSQVVARLRPSIPHYERMRGALIEYYHAAARGGWPMVPTDAALQPGARNRGVSILRTRLLVGLDPTEAALAQRGAADPLYFDADLERAVEHFQERHSIEPDGAVGEGTLRELNHSVETRIDELKLNLDRWRWLPRELGHRYIVVNVAGFELEMIEDGWPVVAMNVVVGKEGWNTPIFADTMESLIVNPSWNVPESIARGEVLPALLRDPGYLDAHHFDVVKGERVVPVASVDL